MKKIFTSTVCIFLTALFFTGSAQTVKWQASPQIQKVFIENKGQFDGRNRLPGSKVLFATDDAPFQVFFTNKGLTYRLETREFRKETDEDEMENQGESLEEKARIEKTPIVKTDLVQMQWENSNPNAEVTPAEVTTDYHCYGTISGARGYKQLLYRNLYPNIDLVYLFQTDKEGIKYLLILHPGADVSNVKMQYSDVSKINSDAKGNLHFPTIFGDIIDHAPLTYYEIPDQGIIPSHYNQSGKTISFDLGNYDRTKTVIIDPWTVSPNMPNSQHVFQCESDSSGNAYVYGGDSPYKLMKYNNAGTLQWTYTNAWDSSTVWCGTLLTDPSGNSYVTAGSSAAIAKVNPAGGQVWLNNGGALDEYWGLAFNCDLTKLVAGGTRLTGFPFPNGSGRAFDINMANGTVNSNVLVAWALPSFIVNDPNEIRAICSSPNGNYYFLTLDTIGELTTALGINYRLLSTYRYAYGSPNYGFTPQGQNVIRATASYIYTMDGANISRRNIATGAIINTVAIPGGAFVTPGLVAGNAAKNGGIAVDSCGYVYVGSQLQVHKFDAALNLISSVATPNAVYDVAVGINGEVIACGNGFAIDVNMSACRQVKTICYTAFTATTNHANPGCAGQCNGTATANPTNGTGPYTYNWTGGGTTQTITNLCAGTYNVTITDQGTTNTVTASVTIVDPAAITLTPAPTNTSCGNNNGSATVTVNTGAGPFSYSWTGGGTTQTISNLGSGSYTVTVTGANSCTATASATVNSSTALALAPSNTATSCGNNNGSASVTVTAGTGPFTYSWTGGATTQNLSNVASGTYNVTVTGAGGCTATASTSVSASTGLTLAPSSTATSCGNNNGSASVTITTGTGPFSYSWTGGATTQNLSNIASGTYNVTVTGAGGCTATSSASVGASTGLTLNPTSNSTSCGNNDGTASVTVTTGTGPFTYSWTGGATTQLITNLGSGNYTVTVTGAGGCTATSSVTIGGSTALTISPSSIGTSCGNNNGSASVTINTGAGPYTYSWTGGATAQNLSNVASGTYNVTVTGAGGCTATATTSVSASTGLTLAPSSSATTCGNSDGTATVNVTAGSGPFTYSWTGGATSQNISNLASGTYNVTVTGAGGCTATSSASVGASTGVTVTTNATNAGCVSNGSATVNITGGNGPFTYSWTGGGTTATISNLSAGSYDVTVTGAGGCTATATATVVSTGSGVTLLPSTTDASCGNSDGSASVSVTTGTAPFTYVWSTGETTSSISNIPGGTYTITVTGTGGCTATASIDVNTTSGVTLSPAAVNTTCGNANGSASVNITTGTGPFTYLWSDGETGSSISNVAGGTFTVIVTGAGNCTATASVIVNSSTGVTINTTPVSTSCGLSNGSASVNVTLGTSPYTYLWSTGGTTASISNLAAGTYLITVTDANSCTATDSAVVNPSGGTSVTITANQTVMCANDTATICAPAGFAAYVWNTGDTTMCILTQLAGNYYVTVTDNGSCTATSNHISITVHTPPPVSISVNGDTLTAYNATTYQWFLNGNPIPGATQQSYIATIGGSYTVEVTDTNGCAATSTAVVISGINNLSFENEIRVYPNPNSVGSWKLEVGNDLLGAMVEIFDAEGRRVFQSAIGNPKSEISFNAASGIYMMRIVSEHNYYTKKLIKL